MQAYHWKMMLKFSYRGVVAKVQSPEAIFSLGVVPVVSFAAPKSKERIKTSVGWNVGTLEKSEMPLKVDKSCMLIDVLRSCSAIKTRLLYLQPEIGMRQEMQLCSSSTEARMCTLRRRLLVDTTNVQQ